MDVVDGIDGLTARDTAGCSSWSASSTGSTAATTTSWPDLRRAAAAHDARPAVITFDAHPDEIVRGAAPPLLCDPDERLARLAAAGVEVCVVQHFDAALRMTEYDAFVGEDRRADRAGRLPDDPRCGVRARPSRHAGRPGGARGASGLRRRWSSRPSRSTGRPVRSASIRSGDRRRRPRDRPPSARPTGRRDRATSVGDRPDVPGPGGAAADGALPGARSSRPGRPPGRSDPPRRAVVEVDADGSTCRPAATDGLGRRARVALGPRLPEAAKPAILRRSKKKTSI